MGHAVEGLEVRYGAAPTKGSSVGRSCLLPRFHHRAKQDKTSLTRALRHRQPSPVYTCMSVQNDRSASPGDDAHVCTYAGVRSHLDLYT